MNLRMLRIYQNGVLIAKIHSFEDENLKRFEDIDDVSNYIYTQNDYFNYSNALPTLLTLEDTDKDGNPELIDSKNIYPVWRGLNQSLVRAGYLLALKQIQEAMFPLDTDSEKVTNIIKIMESVERSYEQNNPIKVGDIEL